MYYAKNLFAVVKILHYVRPPVGRTNSAQNDTLNIT